MNRGNTPINVRFSETEHAEIQEELDRHNDNPQLPHWRKSDLIRAALREFIRHKQAGRREKYETELWTPREPGVPPI